MSTIIELNESKTNKEEQLEKAKALNQQTHNKGQEFTFEGAWKILKDSPKWQIAARLNEKALERASNRKKGDSTTTYGTQSSAGEDDSPKESATPEMVTNRPIRNKKAKELAAIEKKANKNKNVFAESTNAIAVALNQRAKAMESVFEIQLFSLDLGYYKARQFMLPMREFAELEFQNKT
ncbi:unnamed protein product [Calypogeia fissa]